ncbi:MAG: PaaI family thioesterase [bacterium]|nr:PaaI family thioesterase [bacterium]
MRLEVYFHPPCPQKNNGGSFDLIRFADKITSGFSMMTTNFDLIHKYDRSNAFGKLIGMDYKIISEGEVSYHLTIQEKHLATPLSAHGGLIATLVDSALGVAALSAVCSQNKVVSTVEYKTNFLAPVFLGDQLVATGKVIQKGKRILISECEVLCVNRENKLIAKAIGTFNAYDAAKAGY